MDSPQIGKAIQESIQAQADFLATLSVAIVGGLLIIIQIRSQEKNKENIKNKEIYTFVEKLKNFVLFFLKKKLFVKKESLAFFWVSIFSAFLCVLCDFLIYGYIIESSPMIIGFDYDNKLTLHDQKFELLGGSELYININNIAITSIVQIVLFSVEAISAFVFSFSVLSRRGKL